MHHTDNQNSTDSVLRTRSRRIAQAIVIMLLCVGALALVNLFNAQSVVVPTLVFTMVFLSLSLFLLHRGHASVAAAITVFVMFVCIAQAMWGGAGLRSSALMGYPAVLLFAMIMIGKRAFYLALGAMLVYMVLLLFASQQGWRQGTEDAQGYRWLFDYGIILCAAAFIIRVLATDLLMLLEALSTERDALAQSRLRAEHLANHDNLTGLPNRRMAEQYFEELLQQSQLAAAGVGLVFVDVDNFKVINDSHGHQSGDELLRHLGKTIGGQLRKSDRLVRIAGDEFLILLPGINSAENIEQILEKVYLAVATPVIIDGETLVPALSMGIALAPEHGNSFKGLLKKADQAMYQAKAAGRNRYQFFEPEVSPQQAASG